jgi:hypothetical protein
MSADPPAAGNASAEAAAGATPEPPIIPGRRPRSPRRRRAVLLVTVFVAGILVGASAGMVAAPGLLARRMMRARTADMTGALVRQLDLMPEQDRQVRAVIGPHMATIMGIMFDARTKAEDQMHQVDREVMPLLTVEQQQRWRERADRMKHFRARQPGDWQRGKIPGAPHGPDTPAPPTP